MTSIVDYGSQRLRERIQIQPNGPRLSCIQGADYDVSNDT